MEIEVVVYNIDSALRAQEGGADRIELCDNPGEGGTTPSVGMIEVIRQHTDMGLYVMIRPRGGDFHYSDYEFQAMKKDISQCQLLHADGVVFGLLTPEGRIDKKKCKELIELARPLKVTCHRAFDMTRNPIEALEDCIEVGFDRILTSGQQTQTAKGVSLISSLIEKAGDRIVIMPGSGVNEETVEKIVTQTGCTTIHFSAMSFQDSKMSFVNTDVVGMGSNEGQEFKLRTVAPERVKKIKALAEDAS